MDSTGAIVIGATGLIGSSLVNQLLEDPYFTSITILVRKWDGLQDPRLKVRLVNFENKNELSNNISTGETIFCCIGTTQKKVQGNKEAYRKVDFDIPVTVARSGIEKGFRKFILVSAAGANSQASNFYLQLKGTVEEAIIALPYNAHHIFRPSVLLGKRNEKRVGENIGKILIQALSFLLVGNLSRYRAIKAEEVARAMRHAAKNNTRGINIYHYREIKGLL